MASRHGRRATSGRIVSDMFFDVENPPVEPPGGCRHRLLWRLFRAVREDHHPPPPTRGGVTMGATYGSQALIEYAHAQVEAADVLLTHHDEVGLGLCRCGRLHPCPERQQWIQKRAHYVPLLDGPR